MMTPAEMEQARAMAQAPYGPMPDKDFALPDAPSGLSNAAWGVLSCVGLVLGLVVGYAFGADANRADTAYKPGETVITQDRSIADTINGPGFALSVVVMPKESGLVVTPGHIAVVKSGMAAWQVYNTNNGFPRVLAKAAK